MASLTGQTIQSTYDALLKISGNDALTSSLQRITDGLGNFTPLYLSTTSVEISSGLNVVGSITGSNLSGTNTGDETNSTIKSKLGAATSSNDGYLTSTDWSTFNAKQNALGYTPVPQTRTLTINGETYDLSANRSWTIAGGVTSFNTRTGAITLTSGDVTGALGFTPYNATNPNGYISGITRTQVINALATGGSPFEFLKSDGSIDTNSYVTFGRTITINGTTQDLSLNRTFNVGTVTSIELSLGTTGTDANISGSPVTSSGSITLNLPTASATNRGLLSSTDWTIFNNKQAKLNNIFEAVDETIGIMTGIGASPNLSPGYPNRLYVAGTSYFNGDTKVYGVLTVENGNVTSGAFIKTGGTNTQLLNAAGGVITAGSNITISGGTISATSTSQWVTSGSDIYYNTGNVGIGTSSIFFAAAGRTNLIVNGSSSSILSLGVGNSYAAYLYAEASRVELSTATQPLAIVTNGSERMRITSGGNVGIGATSPSSLLTVKGSSNYNGVINIDSTGAVGGGALSLSQNGVQSGLLTVTGVALGSSGRDLAYYANAGLGHVFYTNDGSERMRITSGGNVGIGTSSPNTPLHIAGGSYPAITIQGGSTGGGGLRFLASSDIYGELFGEYESANNGMLLFRVRGAGTVTERMRITSGGNVGIGATSVTNGTLFGGTNQVNRLKVESPSYTCLEINSSSTLGGSLQFTYGANAPNQVLGLIGYNWANGVVNEFYVSNVLNGSLIFGSNNTERMRITSSGNVGIGTSSPISFGGFTSLTVASTATNNQSALFLVNSNVSFRGGLYNNAGVRLNIGTATNHPVVFDTNDFERMRIDSGGYIQIGGTSTYNNSRVNIEASTDQAAITTNVNSSDNRYHLYFRNTLSTVGSISTNGYATSFNTSSDYRLKEDLKSFNGLSILNDIKVYDFKWKGVEQRNYGVVAHEIAEVIHYAVNGEKDGEMHQSVDYSKLVPVLIQAIQELTEKVNKLENGI